MTTSAAAVDREAITSYDRMRPGASHHGYFVAAWQPFTAQSNRISHIGVTVGTPALPAGEPVPYSVTVRLCDTQPDDAGGCPHVLAEAAPQIVNYGNSYADVGDVTVNPGQVYWVDYLQPPAIGGNTWVTFWWSGGSVISTSDQMQAIVRGFNAQVAPPLDNGGGDGTSPLPPATSYRYAVANVDQVNLRRSPDTDHARVGTLPGGTPIDIVCQTVGTPVNGSAIWDRLTSGFFISDWYTTTPAVGDYTSGIPRCEGAPQEPHPPVPQGRWRIAASSAVNLRRGPGVGFPFDGTLGPGARFDIVCQTYGTYVYGSPIWDQLSDGRYVGDYFTDTPAYGDFAVGLPICPGTGPRPPAPVRTSSGGGTPGQSDSAVSPDLAGFSRVDAVAWADAHWKDHGGIGQHFANDCTNFVSHAWKDGGGAQPQPSWWYFHSIFGVGSGYSRAWAHAATFADSMVSHGWVTRTDIPDLSRDKVPGAMPGDVILWRGDNENDLAEDWSHTAIVVEQEHGHTVIDQHTDNRRHAWWNSVWYAKPWQHQYLKAQLLHLRR